MELVNDTYPKATQILCFYHAKEHLCEFAKSYIRDEKDRSAWIAQQEDQILKDNVEEVLEELEEQRIQESLVTTLEKEFEKLINYYTDHRGRMRYGPIRKREWKSAPVQWNPPIAPSYNNGRSFQVNGGPQAVSKVYYRCELPTLAVIGTSLLI